GRCGAVVACVRKSGYVQGLPASRRRVPRGGGRAGSLMKIARKSTGRTVRQPTPAPYALSSMSYAHGGGVTGGRAQLDEYDHGLVWSALLLLVIGLVMVYSASISTAEASSYTGGSATWFLVRQSLFLLVAFIGAALVFQVPMRVWQRLAPWIFLAG